jgi:hypothetical protein
LGIPAHELAQRLPYREFALYEQYAIKHMLPNRRNSMHLAQIAFWVNKVAGGDADFEDFLFKYQDPESVVDMQEVYEMYDFKPRGK